MGCDFSRRSVQLYGFVLKPQQKTTRHVGEGGGVRMRVCLHDDTTLRRGEVRGVRVMWGVPGEHGYRFLSRRKNFFVLTFPANILYNIIISDSIPSGERFRGIF